MSMGMFAVTMSMGDFYPEVPDDVAIPSKRTNELFYYSVALSIQSYAAFSMKFFPKTKSMSKIVVPVLAAGYLT